MRGNRISTYCPYGWKSTTFGYAWKPDPDGIIDVESADHEAVFHLSKEDLIDMLLSHNIHVKE